MYRNTRSENIRNVRRIAHAGLTALLAAGALALVPVAAQASCWSNKAICQAICNNDCCDNWNGFAYADPSAMSEFSVADLRVEATHAAPGTAFERSLRSEVRSRTPRLTRTPTAEKSTAKLMVSDAPNTRATRVTQSR